jgi:hypothetical protein
MRFRLPFLLASGALAAAIPMVAGAQGTVRAEPSPRVTAEVVLRAVPAVQGAAPLKIRVDYGQPMLRGRTLHQGGLVPMDTVWRTGANSATSLVTDVDLMIGSAHVPKGEYTLYTLPTAGGWTLIINKQTKQWGTEYNQAQDLVRVPLRLTQSQSPVEAFTIWLIPAAGNAAAKGELRMAWGTTVLSADWMVH